jgi:hypothetical protein
MEARPADPLQLSGGDTEPKKPEPLKVGEIRQEAERAYERWLQAAIRYDYYITAVVAALLGFIANSYHPQRITSLVQMFDPLSIAVLVWAFLSGASAIEALIISLRFQSIRKLKQSIIEQIRPALDGSQGILNASTGEILDAAGAQRQVLATRSEISALDKADQAALEKGTRHYHRRRRLLTIGFLLLVAGRLLTPYEASIDRAIYRAAAAVREVIAR